MTPERFRRITDRYAGLTVAVVGDFCLDRYLEIDPARAETSIETGLTVHNVTRVRAQPGGAGTIVNNLVALGVGSILPVSFCGDDGEGYELRRSLAALPGVNLDRFVTAADRRTFTYCKPLLMHPGQPPEELNRLDSKNWSAPPPCPGTGPDRTPENRLRNRRCRDLPDPGGRARNRGHYAADAGRNRPSGGEVSRQADAG